MPEPASCGSLPPGCEAGSAGSTLKSVEQTLELLLRGLRPLPAETLDCDRAAGRVLAEALVAPRDLPSFDTSTMDGYALHHGQAGRSLPVSQRIAAGSTALPLAPSSCARIFTGAPIPPGADCVVPQEQVKLESERVIIPAGVASGSNIRRCGSELRQGAVALPAGLRLEAAALGQLASLGFTRVQVRRQPRVALLSTGDELVEPGLPLAPGQIHDANRPMLRRLLERFGATLVMQATVPDDPDASRRLLGEAARHADLVLASGGVSVGEEDHLRAALASLGQVDQWRLNMRPGKPLLLGSLPDAQGGTTRFVGLPGNPVSAFVGAWVFIRPLLGSLLACPDLLRLPVLPARAQFEISNGDRPQYLRVSLDFRAEGISATVAGDQASGVLSSCIAADALALIPAHAVVQAGDLLQCLWLGQD